MKKAKIYIETTVKGPSVKTGAYGVVLEFIAKSGKRFVRGRYGIEEDTTHHRSVLMAMILGLKRFDRGRCEIEIITGDKFIVNAIERGRPADWNRQEWKNSKKQDVAHRDLWQQFLSEMDRHKITVTFSKINVYSEKMLREMNQKLKTYLKKRENLEKSECEGDLQCIEMN